MATSCRLMRMFCKEKNTNTNLIRVPIDDERHSGATLWEAFFTMAVGYPDIANEERRRRAVEYLDSLDSMLPVPSYICSYGKHKRNYDLMEVASGRGAMISYFVDLYKSVADNLPHMKPITVEEVIEQYQTKLVDPSKLVYPSCLVN